MRHTKAEHESEWQRLVSLQLNGPIEVAILDEAFATIYDEDARTIEEIRHREEGEREQTRSKRNQRRYSTVSTDQN